MELTPEKFEKAEFTERRRGYDIDQVESFLEETGTEFAQMLAKFRHTEQRAAAAEARLAEGEAKAAEVDKLLEEADQRIRRAEDAARAARADAEALRNAAPAAPSQADEEAEVAKVAKTLVIAQRTADATIAEAESRAESLLDEARGRADRQMAEAIHEAEAIVSDARRRAEEEYAERHAAALEAVTALEGRRGQIERVIGELERRLSGYREDLQRTAAELTSLAEDPNAIGPHESYSLLPDEVISSSEEPVANQGQLTDVEDGLDDAASNGPAADELVDEQPRPYIESGEVSPTVSGSDTVAPAEEEDPAADVATSGATATDEVEATAAGAATEDVSSEARAGYLDLTSAISGDSGEQISADGSWGPGSWSAVESTLVEDTPTARDRGATSTIAANAMTSTTSTVGHFGGTSAPAEHVDERPTQAVPRAEIHRDKYLEELDQAVNTPEDSDDEALAAFLDGGVDAKARRFGWRR